MKIFIKPFGMKGLGSNVLITLSLVLFFVTPAMATSYTYDQWHRLSSVLYDNGKKITYRYDPAGNLLGILVTAGNTGDSAMEWPAKTNVSADRVWIVRFSAPVAASIIDDIYVTDSGNNRVSGVTASIGDDGESVDVHPPASGYEKGKTYFLNISGNIQSSSGQKLSRGVIMQFNIAVD